ncbi:phage tail sheath family protein [Longimicrobium sp.]|uniref:phage tail sheath family protein n=1 Tax=Longimicrobium sp. TaxID=2029185 RepID=UPI003B3A472B
MPEYLAPGVYVEETSFRAKSIEGVSTSTAGFVGPARYGPVDGPPTLITSFAEFERVFGGMDRLEFDNGGGGTVRTHNYLAQGVFNFFDNGGSRVYVSRIFGYPDNADTGTYGRATADVGNTGMTVMARFPGQAGAARVTLTLRVGGNVLAQEGADFRVLRGVNPGDVVWVSDAGSPAGGTPAGGNLFTAERYFDSQGRANWRLVGAGNVTWELQSLYVGDPAVSDRVHVVSVTLSVKHVDRTGRTVREESWENLGFSEDGRNSLPVMFGADLASRTRELRIPVILDAGGRSGVELAGLLISAVGASAAGNLAADSGKGIELTLDAGSDGVQPSAADYIGSEDPSDPSAKTGLKSLEDIADISIVAAPGYSAGGNAGAADATRVQTVSNALISHAEKMRYRIAVLDSADGQSLADVRAQRAQLDSAWAAFYYPWVEVLDQVTGEEILLPPSGFVSGIYARNDVEKGVHKAPANEVVRGALGFEVMLNKGQQDVLNPEGINCFRFFEGRGNRLWGARTASSDPEWKYVNLRRYFAYLERSIERGTQWAVFENNNEPLWANIRRTIEDFLFSEWSQAHLMGDKPEGAYFVKCDRSTMTQNDIDNGRLVCLIGVAPVRPAEFVIFRIGQWTAEARQ